jgi:uncharacterized RDD family membrane protein YckC
MVSSRNDPNSEPHTYPGQGLGLPDSGPQSIARFGRRLSALAVDWASSVLVVMVITGSSYLDLASSAEGQFYILGMFVFLQTFGIWAIGGSIGHRIFRMYIVNASGGSLNWWRPLVRSLLLALVIPAIMWDSDQRGFHDKIAGTILLRSA